MAVAACCTFAAAQPAFAASPARYADAVRDAARGVPELTTAVVSNDDSGAIRFRVNVGNQPKLARDAVLELFLDTDRNPATGDPLSLGADYRFVLDGASQTFDFGVWDGAGFVSAPSDTAAVWYWSGVSITVNRSELGGTAGLAFWVRATGPNQATDSAPNSGTWSYDLVAGGANPADIESFWYRVRPAAPRAGMTWQLQVRSVRLVATGASVRPERWSCSATLAGRTVRGRGAGGCSFSLPRSARGKRFEVAVTVAYMGEVVTGTLAMRVR